MAETLIKTVRVRRNPAAQSSTIEGYGALDWKLSLYKIGVFGGKRKVSIADSKGNPIPGKDPIEYSTNGRYSDFTDDDFIREYVDTQSKLTPPGKSTITTTSGEKPVYEIIQDPWQDNAPLVRNYGNDPYHMTDGSIITIKWFRRGREERGEVDQSRIPEGGREWSNPEAKNPRELELDKITRDGKEIYLNDKKVYIKTPKGVDLAISWRYPYKRSESGETTREQKYNLMQIVKKSDLKPEDEVEFNGSERDFIILNRIQEIWSYQLGQATGTGFAEEYDSTNFKSCNPDYDSCELDSNQKITFIDPTETPPEKKPEEKKSDEAVKSTDGSKTNATGTKIKLTVNIPSDLKAVANKDVPKFSVIVGDLPPIYKPESDGFSETDEEEQLSEEFVEIEFTDEAILERDLSVYSQQGDADGNLADDLISPTPETSTNQSNPSPTSAATDTPTNVTPPVKPGPNVSFPKTSKAGGGGDRRFQEKTIIAGKEVKNGEVPDEFLAKCTGPGVKGAKLEKAAAKKMDQLAQAYFDKFGFTLTVQGPYRTFAVQTSIFDWPRYELNGSKCKVVIDPATKKPYTPGSNNKCTAAAGPGTSKHGWGQAMDLGPGYGKGGKQDSSAGFSPKDEPSNPLHEKVKEMFEWMDTNAPKYGWVNPAWAKKKGTPQYEPWHWEYTGNDMFKT